MARWAPLLCLLAVLCGCGGDQVADAKKQAHGLAAGDLIVLEALERGAVSPRFAREHLRDSRKNLHKIRKPLKDADNADAERLDAQLQQADQLLQRLEDQPQDAAGAAELQQLEANLREGSR